MADLDLSRLQKIKRINGEEYIILTNAETRTENGRYPLSKLKEELVIQGSTEFNGIATPQTEAPALDGYWVVTEAGKYPNFGGVELPTYSIGFIVKKGNKFIISYVGIEGDYFKKTDEIPNENLTFGEVKEGDENVVSGGAVYKERLSYNTQVFVNKNTPAKITQAVLFFDFFVKTDDLLRADWRIINLGLYEPYGKFLIQLYDSANKKSKDILIDNVSLDGVQKLKLNNYEFYIDLVIDMRIWNKFDTVNLGYKKIHFKDSYIYNDYKLDAELRGFELREYRDSNLTALKVFKNIKLELKEVSIAKDFYITSAGITQDKLLIQLRTDDGDFQNLYSEDINTKDLIKEYIIENEYIRLTCVLDFNILKKQFITSFKIYPIKSVYFNYNYDDSIYNPLALLQENNTYLTLFNKIGVIGDSYASGQIECVKKGETSTTYYNAYYNSWGQIIARKNGIKCINFSSGGLTAKDWWQSKYKAEVAEFENLCDGYFVDLGRNDMRYEENTGTIADINLTDYNQNADSYYGNVGKIISYVREVAPKSKVFLLTIPNGNYTGNYRGFANAIRAISKLYENCFVIDLEKFVPKLDKKHLAQYYNGHPNNLGYMWFAIMINTYADWIIKNNLDNFRDISLVNTDYTLKKNS